MSKPTWEDTEDIELDIPSFEDTEEIEGISKLESGIRGAAQGVSIGFSDEAEASGRAILEDLKQVLSGTPEETPVTFDEQGIAIIPEDSGEAYTREVDRIREENEAAREANPGTYIASEIAGGIAPGLLTGGGAAAANIVKSAATQAPKALGKTVLKGLGAGTGYGAVSGAGYSEAGDIEEGLKDVATGAAVGALGGAVVPVGIAGAKKVAGTLAKPTKAVGDWISEKATSIPIVEEGLEAFKLGLKGKGVVGKKAHQKIIDESKDIVDKELKPFMELNADKYSKAVGSVLKKIGKLGKSKDVSKSLTSINKQVTHLLEENKVPTEEGRKVLAELLKTVERFRTIKTTVSPTKNVKSAVHSAEESLKAKIKKAKVLAKETNESVNFTEPKIDLEAGVITSFETQSGKVISTPIKQGVHTPITYKETPEFRPLKSNEVKSLKDSAYEVLDKAKNTTAGVAKKPIGKLYGTAKDLLSDFAEDANLKGALDEANKGFGGIKGIAESLPADLLKRGSKIDALKVRNRVAQFIRKAEMDGTSGDDLKDSLKVFTNEIAEYDPTFAKNFIPKIGDIAKRYELAKASRESFGLNILGTGKSASIISGSLAGSAANKVVAPISKVANKVNQLTTEQLGSFANKLSSSDSSGAKMLGGRLTEALSKEGPYQAQAIWALSQSPAFREMVKRYAPEGDANLEELDQAALDNIRSDFDLGSGQERGEELNQVEEVVNSAESAIDKVNQQQSSGEDTPMSQLDDLLETINKLQLSEEQIDELEEDATNMVGYRDGQLLKDKIRKLQGLEN